MGPGRRRKSVLSRKTPEEVPSRASATPKPKSQPETPELPRRTIVLALPAPSAPSVFGRKGGNPSRAQCLMVEPPVSPHALQNPTVTPVKGTRKITLNLLASMDRVIHPSFPSTSEGRGDKIARGEDLDLELGLGAGPPEEN